MTEFKKGDIFHFVMDEAGGLHQISDAESQAMRSERAPSETVVTRVDPETNTVWLSTTTKAS